MNKDLYEMIFKRKSFHLFRNTGNIPLTNDEIKNIEDEFNKLQPLCDDIKVKIKVLKDTTTWKRGQEYVIMFYSEKKDNYLQNIGYLGEQLDLYLVSQNIGTLWFGIGKPKEKKLDDLDFVIMMAIKKIDDESKFRKDMFKSKRKEVSEIWEGNDYLDVANIVRFAPSACNLQPWKVISKDNELKVYRYKKEGKRGIMPKDMIKYFNQIDIGIFLCFLELTLEKNQLDYTKEIFTEENHDAEYNLLANIKINR